MNLVLFDAAEIERPLPRSDRRATHILEVLRRGIGDMFDAGIVNGQRGKASIKTMTPEALTLQFTWLAESSPAAPLTLIIGMPRPQTARDILRDATTLGVGEIHFVRTEKADPSYAQSTLWSTDEWRRQLIAGAEQAFDTRIPDVTHGRVLDELLSLQAIGARVALDNYQSPIPMSAVHLLGAKTVTIAIGPERGWSNSERELLQARGFALAHLGTRVLRTETAVTAALAIMRVKLGLL